MKENNEKTVVLDSENQSSSTELNSKELDQVEGGVVLRDLAFGPQPLSLAGQEGED